MTESKRKWPPKPAPRTRIDVTPGTNPLIESPGSAVFKSNGPQAQVVQTNMLSTPVLVVLIVGISISSALGLTSWYISQMAEREARLALAHADRAANDLAVYLEVQKQKGESE